MATKQGYADVSRVLETYFDGLHHANSEVLATVFHPDARYVNATEGDYMNYTMPEYFRVVDGRTSPASENEDRVDRILSIAFGGPNMAVVTASMSMLGRDYMDNLTFIHDGAGWRIVSKVFSYATKPEES